MGKIEALLLGATKGSLGSFELTPSAASKLHSLQVNTSRLTELGKCARFKANPGEVKLLYGLDSQNSAGIIALCGLGSTAQLNTKNARLQATRDTVSAITHK